MILLPSGTWIIKETRKKGRGVFTTEPIKKGTRIAQYVGTLTHILDVDLETYGDYLMDYDDEHCIVPNIATNGAHLINHSCNPNCWIMKKDTDILFVAVRPIQAFEELTIHYLYPPRSFGCANCTHKCSCGSKNCTGSMHMTESIYLKWLNNSRYFPG